jgi:hypothetical protein
MAFIGGLDDWQQSTYTTLHVLVNPVGTQMHDDPYEPDKQEPLLCLTLASSPGIPARPK